MGWITYFNIDNFRKYYVEAKTWGEMVPFAVYIAGQTFYAVGVYGDKPSVKMSPGIDIRYFYPPKIRIDLTALFYGSKGSSANTGIGVVFYKGANTVKDENGNDLFGIKSSWRELPDDSYSLHDVEFELDIATRELKWYADGEQIDVTRLNDVPDSLRIVAFATDVNGTVGAGITKISVSYYDMFGDIMGQMINVIQIVVVFMVVLSVIVAVVRVGRRVRK